MKKIEKLKAVKLKFHKKTQYKAELISNLRGIIYNI